MLPCVPVPSDTVTSSPSLEVPPARTSRRRRERWFSLELLVAIVTWFAVFTLVQPPPQRPTPAASKQPAQSRQYRDQDMIAQGAQAFTTARGEVWS